MILRVCFHRLFFIVLALMPLLVGGCASLPPLEDLEYEPALASPESGPLADMAERFRQKEGKELSGFMLLSDAQDAMEARLALIDLAHRSIDLQYFIWQGDASGILLFDRLLRAADRGVRVRLIVDDFALATSTRNLAALNTHPNLEIRIFNPNPSRDSRILGTFQFLGSFNELNRRMHNKLVVVDSEIALAGGRNIGNAYFGLGKKYNFFDVDVLVLGGVVDQAAAAFDEYWNHDAVYPVSGWQKILPDNTLEQMVLGVRSALLDKQERLASYPLTPQGWEVWLAEVEQGLVSGYGYFLQDDPVEIEGESYRLIDMIDYMADPVKQEFILSTPYLIPVGDFIQALDKLVKRGVSGKIITNSLASTNHTIVNSHYRKYRLPIIGTGTELHEFRHQPSTSVRSKADVQPISAPFVSLHAKVMVSDKRRCFIGSLNFDPRALVINTENGLLIESPELAAQITDLLKELTGPTNSWQVVATDDNRIEWRSDSETLTGQPSRGFRQDLVDFFGGMIPIKNQL